LCGLQKSSAKSPRHAALSLLVTTSADQRTECHDQFSGQQKAFQSRIPSFLVGCRSRTALNDTISAQQATPTRRDVIRQELPGEPPRDISLIEVIYPPGNRFPTASSCQWRRGIRPVREHRLKGRRWSRADVPCRRCLVGTSRCAIYVAPRSATRAGSPARSSSHCARPDGSLE
jgi:hypothetical protein